MSDPYVSHSTGKLKLKGVKDSKISKSKKKKDKSSSHAKDGSDNATNGHDNSVVLKHLVAEDAAIAAEERRNDNSTDKLHKSPPPREGHDSKEGPPLELRKTEAERRYEETRRKRLEERLKREGVKTHKERVQELNRYLSGLSEHHDMPKIGPG